MRANLKEVDVQDLIQLFIGSTSYALKGGKGSGVVAVFGGML